MEQIFPIQCPRQQLEILGFKFGDRVNDLYIHVTFPEGWKCQETEYYKWYNLVDSVGRIRGEMYKSSKFYDEQAYLRLFSRFSIAIRFEKDYYDYDHEERVVAPRRGVVIDNWKGVVVFKTYYMIPSEDRDSMTIHQELNTQTSGWLDSYYPQWRDELAYWF